MHLLYASTLASVAYALALTVPAYFPFPDPYPNPPPRDVAQVALASPRSLCGNIFDDSGDLCGARPDADAAAAEEEEVTPCEGPALVGIVYGAAGIAGNATDRALFAGHGVVKQGEVFGEGYALAEVRADRTVLTRDGERCEVLLFQDPEEDNIENYARDTFDTSDADELPMLRGRFQVPRAELASLAGIRAAPSVGGVRIGVVSAGSVARRVGLRSGDVITQVNGRRLTAESFVEIATELAGQLHDLTRCSALVRRGDEVLALRVDIID